MRWECERGCGDGGGVKRYAIADFHQPSGRAPITFMPSTSHRTKPTLRALVTARSPPAHVRPTPTPAAPTVITPSDAPLPFRRSG